MGEVLHAMAASGREPFTCRRIAGVRRSNRARLIVARWFSIMVVFLLLWIFAPAPGSAQPSPLSQAQALLKEGRPADALPILLELHRSEPSNANVCQQIGVAYTQMQEFVQAEKFYREAVRLNPQFWAARQNLATVLWFLDRKGESEREFLEVTKALPSDPVPHLYLGLAAHGREEFTRAKLEFEKAGTLATENPDVLPSVLETYLAAGDMTFPEKLAQRLAEEHKETPEFWRTLAEAYDRQGKPERAYRAYSRAIELDPNSAECYIAFAEFASAHKNNEYASQVVSRGLEHLPNSPELLFEQGVLSALDGDRNQAEKSLTQAARLKPGWDLPLLAIGVADLEAGEVKSAAAMFQKAVEINSGDYRAYYLYATALERENNPENRAQAVRALRKAIELNPHDARSHSLLGQIELAEDKPDAAALEWRAALKIDPENSAALYQLGLLCRKQGKVEESRRLLARFQNVKARRRTEEESLVEILRVVPAKP